MKGASTRYNHSAFKKSLLCLFEVLFSPIKLCPDCALMCVSFSHHCFSQDILLGLLKKTPSRGSRDRVLPLKVVVMSATLETDKLSGFLGDCPVFSIPGRTYPVKELFCNLLGPKEKDGSAYVKAVSCEN